MILRRHRVVQHILGLDPYSLLHFILKSLVYFFFFFVLFFSYQLFEKSRQLSSLCRSTSDPTKPGQYLPCIPVQIILVGAEAVSTDKEQSALTVLYVMIPKSISLDLPIQKKGQKLYKKKKLTSFTVSKLAPSGFHFAVRPTTRLQACATFRALRRPFI